MVAGRRVPWYALIATLTCTWIGSGSLFGAAGRAFREGFSTLWMSAGAWLGIVIVYFLAGRVRRLAQYTVPDILETRYHPVARIFGTVAIIIAYITIASYQFIGGGRLLHLLHPAIDPDSGKALIALVVILFTVTAGMMSIVSLDVFNGLIIILGIIIAAPLALKDAGGWSTLTETLPMTHFTLTGRLGISSALGLFLPTLFLLLGDSSMYQKFFSAKNENAARKSVIGMLLCVVVVETLLVTTAVFAASSYWSDPSYRTADGGFNNVVSETILLELARNNLPTVAGCLLLAGSFAIVFSTATTYLVVSSTNITRDIYQRFINPNIDEQSIISIQRCIIVLLTIFAYLITTRFTSVLDMALYAFTMVGAAVTPALLAAFLWKRVTPTGGVSSIAAGIVTTIAFGILSSNGVESLNFGLFQLPLDYDYIIYPAATASIMCLLIGSLLTKPSPEEVWKKFIS